MTIGLCSLPFKRDVGAGALRAMSPGDELARSSENLKDVDRVVYSKARSHPPLLLLLRCDALSLD